MRLILTLCVLLAAATANAQTFDLLETPASQAAPSEFDLLHQPEPEAVAASDPLADFDLLFVATPPTPPNVVETSCSCGCHQPNCGCQVIAAGAQSSCRAAAEKPVVFMRSASWCSVCERAKQEITAVKDCPFRLEVIDDADHSDSLPIFEWRVAGKLWTTSDPKTGKTRPGYAGYADLVANWQATQRTEPAGASPRLRSTPTTQTGASALRLINSRDSAIAASVQRHFVARVQGPPVSLSKPGDSEKKSNEHSASGSTPNANGSANKSPPPSGPSMAPPLASTPSPGSRSSE